MWDEIVGYTCLYCGKWATHFYGNVPICCECHIGEADPDSYMAKKMIKLNTLYQKGLLLVSDEWPETWGES
jgi:hypothetical protein